MAPIAPPTASKPWPWYRTVAPVIASVYTSVPLMNIYLRLTRLIGCTSSWRLKLRLDLKALHRLAHYCILSHCGKIKASTTTPITVWPLEHTHAQDAYTPSQPPGPLPVA